MPSIYYILSFGSINPLHKMSKGWPLSNLSSEGMSLLDIWWERASREDKVSATVSAYLKTNPILYDSFQLSSIDAAVAKYRVSGCGLRWASKTFLIKINRCGHNFLQKEGKNGSSFLFLLHQRPEREERSAVDVSHSTAETNNRNL